jgi:hypothetical protein
VVNDGVKLGAELDELAIGKLAAKDRELDVLAVAEDSLEYLPEPLCVADVIADYVCLAHGQLPGPKCGQARNLTEKVPSEEAGLHLEDTSIAEAVAKDRVRDQVVDASLVREEEALPAIGCE